MSLSRKIGVAVDDAQAALSQGPLDAEASEGAHHLRVSLLAASRTGIEATRLTFTSTAGTPLVAGKVKAWGEELARRLTYLMEPLVLFEVDTVSAEAEIRSKAPLQKDGRRLYYQGRIESSGRFTLLRKAFDDASRTSSPVPIQLTREAMERLTDDLVASAP